MKFLRSPGFTLVELLMVFGIGTIIVTSVSLLTGRSLTASRQQVVQVRATEDARLNLQRIAGVIRAARPVDCNNDGYTSQRQEYWLRAAGDDSVSVQVDVDQDGDLELVRYYVSTTNTNELWQSVTEPTSPCVFPTTPTTDRILLRSLNNGATPFFSYFSGPDDATDSVTPNPGQTNLTTITRVRAQMVVSLAEGLAAADTDITTDVSPRAEPCLPSECTPLPTEPVPLISFEGWPASDPDARGTELVVGDGTNIVLSWNAQFCDADPVAANDHGAADWDGQLAGPFGQQTLGQLALSTPNREYTITCSNAFGTSSASVRVTVVGTPSVTLTSTSGSATVDRTGNPGRLINAGQAFTLNWTASNCDGTPQASNNSDEAGFATPFTGWDGPLSGTSGSETYTFPARTSPSHQPPVYFYLECTNSLGVQDTATLFISDFVEADARITIEGTYRGQPVTSSTVVNLNETVEITWSSSSCLNGDLEASGDWSGTKGPSGTENYTNRGLGVIRRFTLSCEGTNGVQVSSSLQFRTPPRPTSSGCRREGLGWRTLDGGCAYIPTNLVWVPYPSRGDLITCNFDFGGRSDWRMPTIAELSSLMTLYSAHPQVLELDDMLNANANPRADWWSGERVGTAHRTRNIADRQNSTLEPTEWNYGVLGCVAPLRTPMIWEICIRTSSSAQCDSDRARLRNVSHGTTFAITWRATRACQQLDTQGPIDSPNEWNQFNIPFTAIQNGSHPGITVRDNTQYGSYILRCMVNGREVDRATAVIGP